MPESMFGRPSQHLLPSHPPASGGSSLASDPHIAPVQAPLTFKDFRFNSIGRQPELLSRISLPQPEHTDYHSLTPSPTSTPPPPFANDSAFQSKSSSRPTLLQQLAGSDFSTMGRWHASTSQPNGSLASRIQMSGSPSNDIANTTPRFPSPPLRFTAVRPATDDASLIPPVEVLAQPPDSAPPTPASWVPTLEPVDVHSPTSSTPLMNTTTITTSEIPAPPAVTTNTAFREPTEPFASYAVVDAFMRGLQPSPSTPAALDSWATRQERLQSISAKLANLASSLPPSSSQSQSQSPPLDPSPVTRTNDNVTSNQSSQSQHSSTPIVLRHPYSANQSSGRLGLSTNDTPVHTNEPSLTLISPPTTLVQQHQTQRRAIIEAIQNLNSVLNVAQRAQIDNDNALVLRTRTFEEQRAAFEQTKRAEEATLQQELQELQQKREELNAKEALLASLEKESKTREEARKGVLAKRQAQEEEKRTAETKRVQEVQEQIANAMDELKEMEALKSKCQLEQLASETVPDDLPTEPQEGMGEEETAVIKSRNDLLCAVKHLRRMHTDKVQKLEESNRTLRRLEEERKKREAEEAERRRIAEEERLRAHAEMQRALQVPDERRRQSEAERKRQEVENDREQPRLSVEQQTNADALVHGVGLTESSSDQTLQYPDHPEEVSAPRHQGIADTRIRAAREETSLSPGNTMNVDEDGTACAPRHTVPLSNIHTSPGGSQSTTSQSKQKKAKPISGGVMLAAPTPKVNGGHLPPKLLAIPPSLSSSDPVAESALNPARSPAIPMSADGEHRSSIPAQLASKFNRAVNTDIRPTPDLKPAFSRTPKSQTVLDATNGGSQELNIGPVSGVSPAQQNVNLRHLKRFRGRAEGNDNGDRSVRTINVKCEDTSYLSPKREEHDDQPRELVQASLSTSLPASLPPRPAIIPPPRPRMPTKRHQAPETDSTSSHPPETNELSSTRRKADATTHELPREALPPDTLSSQATNPPVQLPVALEATNSLLLGPVYPEPQVAESHIKAGETLIQDRGENYDTSSSEPASATLSHELDGEEPPRSNRRFSRNATGSRRMSDHYSPPFVPSRSTVTSPTQPHRIIDSWRPQNPSNGARAEPMRATSPTTGRKRPSEFSDNEHGPRARKRRGDVWVAQDHDRVDSYRPHRDRRLGSEPDERRAVHRAAASPPDRFQSYPSDAPGTTYDNRPYAYVPPLPDWDQIRRTGNDDTYQWYPPSAPGYNAVTDQHHTDDARVAQTYEPVTEERVDVQPDPSLLARMHDTQRFPPRGRGRGEPSRGRGDSGRGRGRGVTRSGPPLIDRLTTGPSSLGDRLS